MKRFKIILIVSVLLFTLPLLAEEGAAEKSWSNTTEFSLVNTTGNSENFNFAITNKYAKALGKATLAINFGALRNETTSRSIENIGGVLVIDEFTQTTAESYLLNGQYNRPINERLDWYARAGWYRDEFSGIDNSYSLGGGIGYLFFTNDTHTLKGELGLGYVKEEYVSGADADFAELRAFLGYDRKIGATSKLFAQLELLENLDNTSDLRANGLVGVSASMSSNIALSTLR